MERVTSGERETSGPPPEPSHQTLDTAHMQGMEYPMYMYKPRRGVKRGDDSKETYKLPHRLIEKKRRDRINECIAQLKDLLPEHLKLTTLGHLEKAVVLELTLKHVKALSEQGGDGTENGEEMFRSGFHLCAKEVLQYLANQESSRDLSSSHLISHIHKVASDVLHLPVSPRPQAHSSSSVHHQTAEMPEKSAAPRPQARVPEGHAMNCVPVIQRTNAHGGHTEQSGSDTDTDSGYGGEHEKLQRTECRGQDGGTLQQPGASEKSAIKQEDRHHRRGGNSLDDDEPRTKRSRCSSSEDESLSAQLGAGSSYMSFSPNQPPFCMPFYLIPSAAAAAAAYLPMLEKCWYSGGMPIMYPPGMATGSAGSLQPEALSSSSSPSSSSLVRSPRAGSPAHHRQTPTMESPTLLHALKQIPHLNMETKD
ncbi:hypothetical protein NHX12_030622 [Muraenolepis orangiensis]|uniref:Uncharacterized protein n=1 Tax=Muraenolepis orangiensis TaxID=630683 RepID=A0A9Q0IJJ6_9TELE|nr:hypothetical protein NHX12_030622 [Muraenolepis orangiensis]